MASTLKRLGRGLAAGLQTLGAQMTEKEKRKREDAIRAEQRERDDKRFEAEQSTRKIRNEQLTIQNQLARAEMSVKSIGTTWSTTNGNPEAMAESWTKNLHNGYTYTYDEEGSRKAVDAEGNPLADAVVMKVWTREDTPEGTTKVNPITGKPILNSLPGDFHLAQYNSKEDFFAKVGESMNSDLMFGRIRQNISSAEAKKAADTAQANKIATEVKKQEGRVALVEQKGVEARKTKAAPEAAGGVGGGAEEPVEGLGGKVSKQTVQGVKSLQKDTAIMAKEGFSVNTSEMLKFQQLLGQDPESADFRKFVDEKIAGMDDVETITQFLVKEAGIPRELAEKVIERKGLKPGMTKEEMSKTKQFFSLFGF
jgi:hypothetical protein